MGRDRSRSRGRQRDRRRHGGGGANPDGNPTDQPQEFDAEGNPIPAPVREGRTKEKKEKKERPPKRSRSEESAERSREREKRRRRAQRDFMMRHGSGANKGGSSGNNDESGGGSGAKVSNVMKKGTGGMFWDGFQWIQNDTGGTGFSNGPGGANGAGPGGNNNMSATAIAQRRAKRLYLGNLPKKVPGLGPGGSGGWSYNDGSGIVRSCEEIFKLTLVEKMKEVGIIGMEIDGGNMDFQIWFHADQNYGFLECESVEQAQQVLARCDNMLVCGQPIQIRRPTDNTVNKTVIPGLNPQQPGGPLAIANTAQNGGGMQNFQCTTRILQIMEALKYDQNETVEADFQDTLDDMIEGCENDGVNQSNCRIIMPQHMELLKIAARSSSLNEMDPEISQIEIGYVFCEFPNVQCAQSAMNKMSSRKYDSRYLRFASFNESKFIESIVPLMMPNPM